MQIRIINPSNNIGFPERKKFKTLDENSKLGIPPKFKNLTNEEYKILIPILKKKGLKSAKEISNWRFHNNDEERSILNKSKLTKENNKMATKRKRTVRRKNPSVPVFANRHKRRVHRRRNPASIGAFSVEGVVDTVMQGLIAGAGAVGVKFVTDKFLNFDNVWLKYLAMAGIGLGGGYIAGTFNKNLGKQISIGSIALVAVQILQDQILKPGGILKGEYYEDDQALGNLTLGEIAQFQQNELMGASTSGGATGVDRMLISNNGAYSDDPYSYSNSYGMP